MQQLLQSSVSNVLQRETDMFLVHRTHLVGHQQLFSILTQSSSLGDGQMKCHIQSTETEG